MATVDEDQARCRDGVQPCRSIAVAAVGAWVKWRRSSVRSDAYFHVSLRRSGKPSRRASSSAWRRVMSPSFLEGGGQGVKEGVHLTFSPRCWCLQSGCVGVWIMGGGRHCFAGGDDTIFQPGVAMLF